VELVLVGGGHSHVEVLRRLALNPVSRLRVTLVSRDPLTAYSGMLPGHLAGHYTREQCHIDLRRLSIAAGARLVQANVVGLDLHRSLVLVAGQPSLHYDLLSLNTGSQPQTAQATGAEEHAIPAKPVSGLLAAWDRLLENARTAASSIRIGVVGAGVGGVELALTAQYRLRRERARRVLSPDDVQISLFSDAAQILPGVNVCARQRLLRILTARGVRVYTNSRVTEVRNDAIRCEDGRTFPLDAVFWVTHAAAPAWLPESGLATDALGFVLVNDYLQSASHAQVFAAGDIAASRTSPRPKSGVFAVRQGPPLAENLRRAALGMPLRPFKPQRNYLSLIGTGEGYAVATRGMFSAEGRWVWRWKNWIDRRFMARYNELATVEP
jgi:selenide,water dikinase